MILKCLLVKDLNIQIETKEYIEAGFYMGFKIEFSLVDKADLK